MKNATTATKPTSNPITRLLFQGWVCPPYCNANMYDTIKLIMRAAPIRSICSSFSLNDACAGLTLDGVLKKMETTMAAMPPMGRLIQKH